MTPNSDTKAFRDDLSRLVEDARALLEATADVTEDKVSEARKRLASALESGKELYSHARAKAVEGAEPHVRIMVVLRSKI